MKFLRCLFLTAFFYASFTSKAQVFDFNSWFTSPAIFFYAPDSNNLIYNELRSQSDMVAQIDSIFPYFTSEYFGAYPKIVVDSNSYPLYGLHNLLPTFSDKAQEIQGKFTLNGKEGNWYAYYKKSTIDTTTAVLIFPGYGLNQSFPIANNQAENYHNLDCIIKEKALEFGDAYMIVKPNEEFRALWTTTSPGIYSKLDYDVMGPYTSLIGKNWAANLYIEYLAQLKFLQSKYKRVITMGLSNGGFPALVCGLEAGVDGINCASGISVSSYQGFPLPNNENPLFSNLLNYYALDSLKKMIASTTTQILFTYGAGDGGTNAFEHNTRALENYLATSSETCNASFFYNFVGHTFSCEGVNTFFDKVTKSPKLKVLQQISDICYDDTLRVNLQLEGTAPFTFDLYLDSVFYRHYEASSNEITIPLHLEGFYRIKNITDASGESRCKGESFTYKKKPDVDISSLLYKGRDCANFKDKIELKLTGIKPFVINTNIAGYENFVVNDTICNIFAAKGSYTIYSIADSNNCPSIINRSLDIVHDTLGFNIVSQSFDCVSNKILLNMALSGTAPWIIHFNNNGNPVFDTVTSNNYQKEITEGLLQIVSVEDSTGCILMLNNVINVAEKPVRYKRHDLLYNCNSGFTQLNIQLENYRTPAILVYSKTDGSIDSFLVNSNNLVANLPNGVYQLLYIYDSLQCRQMINQTVLINERSTNIRNWSIEKNCFTQKYTYHFSFEGKAPYTLRYNYNNVFYTKQFTNDESTWEVNPGNYYLINVSDRNGCEFIIQREDTLQENSALSLFKNGNILYVSGGVGLRKSWYRDNVLIEQTNNDSIIIKGNGMYRVSVESVLGCNYVSNELKIESLNTLHVYPNPASQQINIVLNEAFRGEWQYRVLDNIGNNILGGRSFTNNTVVNISYLAKGVYYCSVEYLNEWNIKSFKTIKFIKQ